MAHAREAAGCVGWVWGKGPVVERGLVDPNPIAGTVRFGPEIRSMKSTCTVNEGQDLHGITAAHGRQPMMIISQN